MKMHFGQLQAAKGRIKAADPLKAGVPAWIPPAWIIPLIDKDSKDKRKAPKDERPRVEIPVGERAPPEYDIDPSRPDDSRREPEDEDRGVVILEFKS